MSQGETVLIAVGGGQFGEAKDICEYFIDLLKKKSDPRLAVMTVATNKTEAARQKYDSLFRRLGINHVSVIDVSERKDAFNTRALDRIGEADALFFTGGDQLNITSLLGGTPLHDLIDKRYREGIVIAGTSAGAMMMSNSLIVSGKSDRPPRVNGVQISPGMALISDTMIDTHFSQRGRHGRLLTAIAHYPQNLGLGIDERTALVVRGDEFRVIGEGAVTVVDASKIRHSDLPYRNKDELIGLFDVCVHVLPAGYRYNLKNREPIAPALKTLIAGTEVE